MRFTFVPQSGHVPLAILVPRLVNDSAGFCISTFFLHFTQYAIVAMRDLLVVTANRSLLKYLKPGSEQKPLNFRHFYRDVRELSTKLSPVAVFGLSLKPSSKGPFGCHLDFITPEYTLNA
jgi:hypothetical protein